VLNFNVHNILKFRIIRNKRSRLFKDLNLEFSFFETNEAVSNPEITLRLGKFRPLNENCYVIERKYHIKENYFYCKDSEGRAKWQVEILGFEEGNTIVNFHGRIFGPEHLLIPDFLAQDIVLKPLIAYKLAMRGYFLIHSAGICKNNHAYLLIGRGGAYKTSLVMDFMRKAGYSYLGDDWVIIHKNKALCFPVHLSQFGYRLRYLPTENLRSLSDRINLFKYLSRSSHRRNNIPIARSSEIEAIFIIARKQGKEMTSVRDVSVKEALDKLIANNILEMMMTPIIFGDELGRFFRYMLAYSYVFPYSSIAFHWNYLRKGLEGVLSRIPIYEIKMPLVYDSNVFNHIRQQIELKLQ